MPIFLEAMGTGGKTKLQSIHREHDVKLILCFCVLKLSIRTWLHLTGRLRASIDQTFSRDQMIRQALHRWDPLFPPLAVFIMRWVLWLIGLGLWI